MVPTKERWPEGENDKTAKEEEFPKESPDTEGRGSEEREEKTPEEEEEKDKQKKNPQKTLRNPIIMIPVPKEEGEKQ